MSVSTSRKDNKCSFCGKTHREVKKLIAGPSVFICDECIDLCLQMLQENNPESAAEGTTTALPTPREIVAHLDEFVIGQAAAKRALAVAVYNHYKRLQARDRVHEIEISKSNILLIGPTGSGKTLLAQTLARMLKVPFAMADATTLTEAGYVGEDVEHIIQKLLQNADYKVEDAERGIVYLDEIDKISRKSDNPSITRDVSGEGVQQALLKLIEGTEASVPPQGGRKHPNQEYLKVRTDNILFICGGAFDGLEKIIAQRQEKGGIGFAANIQQKRDLSITAQFKQVEPEDLIKFGLIPELIGRLPVVTSLEELDEDALVRILTEPKNALVKQFDALLQMDGAELSIDEAALKAIAAQAIKRKTGARGLRTIVEEVLQATMFDLPDDKNVVKVMLNADCVLNGKTPQKIRVNRSKAA